MSQDKEREINLSRIKLLRNIYNMVHALHEGNSIVLEEFDNSYNKLLEMLEKDD